MKKYILVSIISSLFLVGCADMSQYRGDVYSGQQVKTTQLVSYGTIIESSPAKIKDEATGVGAIGGGIIGGIAGSTIGGGKGRLLGTAVGALAGVVAGNAAENAYSKGNALSLTIRKDNGEIFDVVQGYDKQLVVGAKVKIVQSRNGNINIMPRY